MPSRTIQSLIAAAVLMSSVSLNSAGRTIVVRIQIARRWQIDSGTGWRTVRGRGEGELNLGEGSQEQ